MTQYLTLYVADDYTVILISGETEDVANADGTWSEQVIPPNYHVMISHSVVGWGGHSIDNCDTLDAAMARIAKCRKTSAEIRARFAAARVGA